MDFGNKLVTSEQQCGAHRHVTYFKGLAKLTNFTISATNSGLTIYMRVFFATDFNLFVLKSHLLIHFQPCLTKCW